MMTYSLRPKTWVFIVGHCEEWEEDRTTLGDRGLFHAFLHHFPASQICYVKDDKDCTRANCEDCFRRLLQQTRPGDTLFFYYGGHGTKKGLKTLRGKWFYEDIVQLVESYFKGDKAWFLLDCCYSASLSLQIPDTSHISYLCLSSQAAHWDASDLYWAMTECMIHALQYTGTDLTIHDFVNYMTENHAVKKFDWFQATFHGASSRICPTEPFPFNTWKGDLPLPTETASSTSKTKEAIFSIASATKLFVSSLFLGSSDITQLSAIPPLAPCAEKPTLPRDPNRWKRLVGLKPGDKVYAKWTEGKPPGDLPYLLPMYYEATITSPTLSHGQDQVEVQFQHKNWRWRATVSQQGQLLPISYFYLHEHEECKQAHVILARHGRFVDSSIAPNTRVWGYCPEDEKVYEAEVMEEPPWTKVTNKLMKQMPSSVRGPCVWVEWEDEDDWDLIPKCHVMVQPNKPSLSEMLSYAQQNAVDTLTPEQAILACMHSMGKHFSADDKDQEVVCYWDGADREAALATSSPSLEVFVQHLDFDAPGKYCCVRWKNTGDFAMVPSQLIVTTGNKLGSTW